jgi:hypothetical protein
MKTTKYDRSQSQAHGPHYRKVKLRMEMGEVSL